MLRATFDADLETPVSCYLKLRGTDPHSFLLESVEGSERWAAYSVIGVGAAATLRLDGSGLHLGGEGPLGSTAVAAGAEPTTAALRAAFAVMTRAATDSHPAPAATAESAPPFVGGAFGFFSYDLVRRFERVGSTAELPLPDAYFFRPQLLAVFDNRRHSLTLYAEAQGTLDEALRRLRGPLPAPGPKPATFVEPTAEDSRAAFMTSVEQAKEHIRAGDIIQVVLSRRFTLPPLCDPFLVYRGLRRINPSPYMYFLEVPELTLAGASPETMFRVRDRQMVLRPIAGTRPRGADGHEDERLAQELLADPKERAEHIMLVDLGRNDVGRVSMPGSVSVPDLMVIERYSHVMHIVSEVRGELARGLDVFDALRAAFPAGTLSGAPKVRAMQIIDELEKRPRGLYGGAVGYIGPRGDADFGIAIRTLLATPERFVVQAGAGIVADSQPSTEADETEHKARSVLRAIAWACDPERH